MKQLDSAVTRRDFLKAGAVGVGATLAGVQPLTAANPAGDVNCIVLFLVGGPSQLETFDPKPDAPTRVRGPFGSIRTSVPGIHLSEHLPRTAALADRFAILRSVHHTSAPIHETGQQLLQTGRLSRDEREQPNIGAVLSHRRAGRAGLPASAIIPTPIVSTGVSVSHGQGAGFLGPRHEPADMRSLAQHVRTLESEDARLRESYGRNAFGESCLLARQLVESGVRLVTVNMFDTVFDKVTWDCHADGGSLGTTLVDYSSTLCPMFDAAYATLLTDLEDRGMLSNTLVVAMGEFGRTPLLNPRGGRDHWPGCWSVLFAGAGVPGGQTIGSSDACAGEPKDRPIDAAQVAATIHRKLGVDTHGLIDAEAVSELI